jgi:hypothetical protein
MSNTHMEQTASAVNATSTTVQVPPLEDRLVQALVAAQHLQSDAWRLKIEVFVLRSEIEEIVEDPAVPPDSKADLDAAFDAVTWLQSAAENADDEFETLICNLNIAVDALSNADTD